MYLRVVLEVCRLPLAAHRTPTAPALAPLAPGTWSIPTTNPKQGARLRVAAAGQHRCSPVKQRKWALANAATAAAAATRRHCRPRCRCSGAAAQGALCGR